MACWQSRSGSFNGAYKMKIETVAVNAIQGLKTGYEIYLAAAKAMDSIEEKAGLSGRSKLEWVLAFIKGSIEEVATNWDYWSTLLIKFISSIKTIYNIVK